MGWLSGILINSIVFQSRQETQVIYCSLSGDHYFCICQVRRNGGK